MSAHQPVLYQEVLTGLSIKPSGKYIDATFGRGGHSGAILSCLNDAGQLLAFDQDPAAVQAAQAAPFDDNRFSIVAESFVALTKVVAAQAWTGAVDGILMDLGVSSPQLDDPQRGFSFSKDGPLDMRMNPDMEMSAAQWIQQATDTEIADVLWRYGQERYSRRIARAIVAARELSAITTTGALSEIIAKAHPAWERRIHPATRSFQAIRIHINAELDSLASVLEQCLDVLAPQGRLCVISFHSLEDRMVKQFIRRYASDPDYPPGLPVPTQPAVRRLKKIGRLIRPHPQETQQNPRARSARLRIAEKIQ